MASGSRNPTHGGITSVPIFTWTIQHGTPKAAGVGFILEKGDFFFNSSIYTNKQMQELEMSEVPNNI